ncbi:hypothetical protein LCGC14_2486730 [marine sediment metagenome]|uniref:Uncharacterized protein n=1 Tax=marine sediment metagenome TaxID=412755 RepID=A0A0F9DZQ2_9ZZZZ
MANEATVTTSLQFAKGSVNLTLSDAASTFDVTGTRYIRGVQEVGTSEEALDMGDLTDPGWCYMRNLDTSNFVEVYAATAETAFMKLKAGEHCCFRLVATAPFVKADTGSIDLEYMIVQD